MLLALAGSVRAEEEEPLHVVVGGDHSYPPYEFIDESGKPNGFNVELTQAVARVMGFDVEFRLGSWGTMRQALANGDVDILQGMAYSKERTSEVDFSLPNAVVHQSIWNRKDGPQITSVKAMTGREVIVMRGSIMHDYMLRNQPEARLILVESLADALRQLASGKHDCALVAKLPGQYLVDKYGLTNITPTAKPLVAQDYGYAVRKGNWQLLARFNDGLAILHKTGEFEKISRRWLGVLEPQPLNWKKISGYMVLAVTPFLLGIGAIALWSRLLKKEVAQRTQALEQEVTDHRRTMDELKVRQRQLIQADKMTSLGILVSGVAHEINNPTGLILLNMPHLEKAFSDADPVLLDHYNRHGDFRLGWLKYTRMREEIPQMFQEMHDAAQRIKRIVEDLKDFARQDDNDRMQRLDLNAVVATALRLVDNQIRKATDHFSLHYAEGLPRVQGNHQRIEQVIVNLVLNACQALPSTAHRIWLQTALSAEGAVQVVLRDEGSGIPQEHLPHLTDPFFTTKREQGGTGLGLSISAGIVREHGGTLHFDSQPGQGTTVTLTLPVCTEEEA